MGLNRLCNIKYLNLDARSVNSKCEDCVNVARLLELQTRRASKKFIARGYFFNDLLEKLHLGDLDAGDLLLLFLLFYLSRQKADEELLIAIGLLLIL